MVFMRVRTSNLNAAMKKFMKSLVLFAAAAMALTSCENEMMNEGIESNEAYTLTFTADAPESRTSVSIEGNTASFDWSETETFAVLANDANGMYVADNVTATIEGGKAKITASFTSNTPAEGATYVAVYPASAYVTSNNTNFNSVKLKMKEKEHALVDGTFDPEADLMISQPVTAVPNETTNLKFGRLTSVARMNLKGVTAGETIENIYVEFTDVTITNGRYRIDLATGLVIESDENAPYYGFNYLNLKGSLTAAAETPVFFTCLPGDYSGDYVVTVETDAATYTKEGTIDASKPLAFTAGNVLGFNVAYSAEHRVEKGEEPNTETFDFTPTGVYENGAVVSSVEGTNFTVNFAKGDASSDCKWYKNGYAIRVYGGGEISVMGKPGYLVNSVAFTFGSGDGSNAITGAGGVFADNVWTATTPTDNVTFKVDGTTGHRRIATMVITYTEGAVPFSMTAPENVNLTYDAQEGTAKATVNGSDGWNIAVSSNATWLTVENTLNANNEVVYSATENTDASATRTATVTLTATKEGETTVEDSFEITQAKYSGIITLNSIAEFLAVDVNTTQYYKLTGRIIDIASSTYGNITIADETGSVYIYGLTKTKQTSGNDRSFESIGLELGNKVTIGTLRDDHNGPQGGGQNAPAYYISHVEDNSPLFISLNKTALEFAAAASSADVVATTIGTDSFTVTDNADWITTSVSENTITINATANTLATKRTATVSITFGGNTKTVSVTQAEAGSTTVTEEMSISGTTGTLNGTTSISWTGEKFDIVNYKNTSSTAIRTNDSDHFRCYVGNNLTFSAKDGKKFTKIVLTCTGESYASLSGSTFTGATATASGTTITLTCTSDNVSIVIGKQMRIRKVVATMQ